MIKKILNAITENDIKNLINAIESTYPDDFEWVPVGNTFSNLSTLQMLERGENGVIERLTNAIDAVIEREYIKNPDINLKNPRQSSEKYFNIKNGDLSKYQLKELNNDLKNLVELNVFESGKNGKPTIEVRDYGIGISADRFGKTILSLQGGNKLDKYYLAGTFGQGGSTAISFSPYVLFISKVNNGTNKVSFTITKETDDLNYKTPVYMYLIRTSTQVPFEYEDSDNEFETGTCVRQISMNINQYGKSDAVAPGNNSLLYLVNKKLFNPILPIKISENRRSVAQTHIEQKNNTRTAIGANSRLNNSSLVIAKNTIEVLYEYGGKIHINYWIFDSYDEYKNFNDKTTPILFTINGQVQGTESSNVFEKINKPYLTGHLLVNVDCDYMEDKIKTRLFTSDRAKFQDNDFSIALRNKVRDILENDQELVEFNLKYKQQLLSRNDNSLSEELNKKIENKLKIFINTGGIGKTSKEIDFINNPNPNPRPKPFEIELFEIPTYFNITNKDPMEVEINKEIVLNYNSDANDSYELLDKLRVFCQNEDNILFIGHKFYSKGHGITIFKFGPDVKVGDEIRLTLYIDGYQNSSDLSSSITIRAVDKKKAEENENKSERPPEINTYKYFKKDLQYVEFFGEDDNLPTVLRKSDNSIDIHINMENNSYKKLLENVNKIASNAGTIENISNEYVTQISFYSLLVYLNNKNKKDDDQISDEILNEEIKRSAILITGMINDNIRIYTVEANNESNESV